MSAIDPNSEMMIALDDAWAVHWAFNYSTTPNRKLFYKFASNNLFIIEHNRNRFIDTFFYFNYITIFVIKAL